MGTYMKKPVVIEAWPFDGSWASAEPIIAQSNTLTWASRPTDGVILIKTLEGTMEASPGDWIIRGIKGEFYPCKPDIFEATYAPVMSGGAAVPAPPINPSNGVGAH